MDLSGKYIKGTGSYEVKELVAQDAVLKHLDKGSTYLECTSSGTIAFPSDQAYGEWEFDLYKDLDTSLLYFNILNDRINGNHQNFNGYGFYIAVTETIYFRRQSVGSYNNLINTDSSYVAINTWYRVKITRTLDGVFYLYIKGGDFGSNEWTLITADSGTNPVTDNVHTTSKYFTFDLDAGDRIANIVMRPAVKQ